MKSTKRYNVTFKEVAIVTEEVSANSKAEAIRKVKDGLGERLVFEVDELRGPTGHVAAVASDRSPKS